MWWINKYAIDKKILLNRNKINILIMENKINIIIIEIINNCAMDK